MRTPFITLAALAIMASPAIADIRTQNIRAFETSEGLKNGAVFLDIENTGNTADRLIGASTPAAADVQIHNMSHENGIMKMRRVQSLHLPAGKTESLSADGYHLMLIGLKKPLRAGESHPLVLKFESGDKTTTSFKVTKPGDATAHDPVAPSGHHHH